MTVHPDSARILDPDHCSLEAFQTADAAMRRCLDPARTAAQELSG
jgi:hypothetical protein